MRRIALAALGLAILALVGSQLLIPELAENRIRDRLTEGGGRAAVSVSAFPALRLLFGQGDRLEVRARQVEVELTGEGGALERLDGFGEVDIEVVDAVAGPVEVDAFRLARAGEGPYSLTIRGSASPRDLAAFAGAQVAGPLAELLSGAVPLPDVPVPIAVDGRLVSDAGEVRVVGGDARIAGIPIGPLAAAIAAALVDRIGL